MSRLATEWISFVSDLFRLARACIAVLDAQLLHLGLSFFSAHVLAIAQVFGVMGALG